MLTKNEITTLNLSPTKKDFVQIWNELLEVAGKLSERWDPTSTNESDPGIVILKALTGIADKLNYNIDKNILEAFMPTASQEDSMRKLCEMLGYNIKYYQSAKTDVTIKYYNPEPTEDERLAIEEGLLIPKFTVLTNNDQDISYFTINETPYYISSDSPSQTIECMEGQIVQCESINDNNVISVNQISENNRFYLPETQIAENGIFIYNIFYSDILSSSKSGIVEDGTPWQKVDNLNTHVRGSRIFKFGYDSYESRPYIEFPEDYSDLFGEGILLYYTRTNGVNGNISPRTLTQLELPNTEEWSKVSAESFSVENVFSATTGANVETIKQAYNNFKKTIGTFDALVTCRDYMNKIYTMVNSTGRPYVSNILVTDIRNDLNKAVTICSCDDAGIFYKETPLSTIVESKVKLNIPETTKEVIIAANRPIFNNGKWYLGTMELAKTKLIPVDNDGFSISEDGEVGISEDNFYTIKQNDKIFKTCLVAKETITLPAETTEVTTESEQAAIDHFDLVFYPFKSYSQIKSNVKDIREVYDSSFNYTDVNLSQIESRLNENNLKTVAHRIKKPNAETNDIVSINNYLRLNAIIATNSKITVEEGDIIKDNIKIALANAFNMRELDFGEEIPFDSIVDVIEKADSRIKVASLSEPAIYTTFSVLEANADSTSGTPKIVEYAVASDWLSTDTAAKCERFEYKKTDDNGVIKTYTRFNSKEAKEIYNKLAVRNILAGRVPLFDYNSNFTASFYESPYQVTTVLEVPPKDAVEPNLENPQTIWTDNDKIYIGKYTDENIIYTETSVPENCNFISENEKGKITSIDTTCDILADENGRISNVKLNNGEFIKFRSPNFTTIKTYPAYVNYHLKLQTSEKVKAKAAEGSSLFNILDTDRLDWTKDNQNIKWQRVLDYFKTYDLNQDASGNQPYHCTKPFTLSQKISKFVSSASSGEDECVLSPDKKHERSEITGKCKYCGVSMMDQVQKGPIIVSLDNDGQNNQEYTIEELLAKSGCIKLINTFDTDGFKARLTWSDEDGDQIPQEDINNLIELKLNLSNPFISDANILNEIKETITTAIEERKNMVKADGVTPVLPTQCAWTISFDFECVPFEPASLTAWDRFIRQELVNFKNGNNAIFDFEPKLTKETPSTYFWRLFGEGYSIGEYILNSSEKLLKFDSTYFGLLPENRLTGIYLVKDYGQNAVSNSINNEEEYELKDGEALFIEYTPSSTTADGTSQELDPVTEIYGQGTIIRPSGFNSGLVDSTFLELSGTSPHKQVTFEVYGANNEKSHETYSMHRFGANEQVEIRDFLRVILTKDKLKNASAIYVYKNFNDCPELELYEEDDNGNRINNTYTLKEGEYIFYTDHNKAELAYFTNGTQVTLTGDLVLFDAFEAVDIAAILENGMQEIPWRFLSFEQNDAIEFQEYQYITLGPTDTLKSLSLLNTTSTSLNKNWTYCDDVSYYLADNPDKISTLPAITVGNSIGCGWEACSILELSVSADNYQVLRADDKVETGLKLTRVDATGGGTEEIEIKPVISTDDNTTLKAYPLAFKTNIPCQSNGNYLSIDDIYTTKNTDHGFEFKMFMAEEPAIVKTLRNKVLPADNRDFNNWSGEPIGKKEYLELWNTVSLDKIRADSTDATYDNALRLSISVIPNTYGIICIYVHYTSDESRANSKTWIDLIPGISKDSISIFNTSEDILKTPIEYIEDFSETTHSNCSNRLYLHEGINCIRVNTSTKLFIKASSDAQGTVSFDDPKLVNYKNIIDEKSKKIIGVTHGLNLNQIGYLDAINSNSLVDSVSTEDLEKSLITEAVSDLEKVSLNAEATFERDSRVLINNAENLKDIVTDIESLLVKNGEAFEKTTKYAELLDTCTDLTEILKLKTDLLDSLNKSKSLQVQLSDIVNRLSDTRAKQLELVNLFNDELDSVEKSINSLEADDILESFKQHYEQNNAEDHATAVVSKAALQLYDTQYREQQKDLIDELGIYVNAENKEQLNSFLYTLKADLNASENVQINTLVSKLSTLSDTGDIEDILVSLSEAAAQPDYNKALSLLNQLEFVISSDETAKEQIIKEMEIFAEQNNYSQLQSLINDLRNLNVDKDKSKEGILTAISELKTSAKNFITSTEQSVKETPNSDFITKINNLSSSDSTSNTSILSYFNNRFGSKLTELEDILDEIGTNTSTAENNISTLVSTIGNSNFEKVTELVTKITALDTEYKTNTDILSNTLKIDATKPTWENIQGSSVADIYNSVIISVWQELLKTKMQNSIETVKLPIFEIIEKGKEADALKNGNETLTIVAGLLRYNNELTALLTDFEKSLFSFSNIYIAIESMWIADEHNKSYISIIEKIFKSSIDGNSVINSINAITGSDEETKNKFIAIINILNEITADTNNATEIIIKLVKKPELVAKLKEELISAKLLDEQLISIIKTSLYPNIAKLKNSLDNTNILYKTVKDIEDKILKDILSTSNVDYIINLGNALVTFDKDKDKFVAKEALDTTACNVIGPMSVYYLQNVPKDFVNVPSNIINIGKELFELLDAISTNRSKYKFWIKDLNEDLVEIQDKNKDAKLEFLKSCEFADKEITAILEKLIASLENISDIEIGTEVKRIVNLEEQLLKDIAKIDINRDFYYSAPIEAHLAIDFNESDDSLNTLQNPMINYDINNINNSFVISKLDISYLDKGLQIARSSRLN